MVSGQWVSEDSGFEIRNLGWVQDGCRTWRSLGGWVGATAPSFLLEFGSTGAGFAGPGSLEVLVGDLLCFFKVVHALFIEVFTFQGWMANLMLDDDAFLASVETQPHSPFGVVAQNDSFATNQPHATCSGNALSSGSTSLSATTRKKNRGVNSKGVEAHTLIFQRFSKVEMTRMCSVDLQFLAL
ncbi:hypothetical protein ACFXTI_016549 [Malus domestica]